MPRPVPLYDPIKNFVLYTNAKCGGTTLKAWFFANLNWNADFSDVRAITNMFGLRFALALIFLGRCRLGLPVRIDYSDTRQIRLLSDLYRLYYSQFELRNAVPTNAISICVCRDPYTRAASAFLDKFCGSDHQKKYVTSIGREIRKSGDISFLEFLKCISGQDEASLDPHWCRQTYILDGKKVDHFCRLENLKADFQTLSDIVGGDFIDIIDMELQSTTTESLDAHNPQIDLSTVRASEIIMMKSQSGTYPSKHSLLTAEAKKLINRIYAEDFKRLPYRIQK